jgi:uncharacterized protein (DUF2147 family)
MKTLGFAMVLALTGGAAQAGSMFEIPINGGVARIQLDDNCGQSVCASLSWTGSDRHKVRKEDSKGPAAGASAKLQAAPAPKPESSDPAPASGNTAGPSISSGTASAPALAPASTDHAGSGSTVESPAMASREPDENVAPAAVPAAPVLKPSAVAAIETSEPSPVGEWLVEDGDAHIRIETCGKNLCGIVSDAKNSNEKDRKNPNPELRDRPIIGMPILLDMQPAKSNRWEGRVYNAKNGQTYTANISLNNSQSLRVEGCAFGGLICGGQDWTRVN